MNKGFVFIETIITVVILCASLIYLYSSYSSIINSEETRIYYDDPAYVYKANYLRDYLINNSNIEKIKNDSEIFEKYWANNIGPNYENLFLSEEAKADFGRMWNNFHVRNMLLITSNLISECDGNLSGEIEGICEETYDSYIINYHLRNYIRSLNETDHDYYIVIEFSETLNDNGDIVGCNMGADIRCHSYYVSLGI